MQIIIFCFLFFIADCFAVVVNNPLQNQTHLVIGLGHTSWLRTWSRRPMEYEYTIDIDRRTSPDIIANIFEEKTWVHLEKTGHIFQHISFERVGDSLRIDSIPYIAKLLPSGGTLKYQSFSRYYQSISETLMAPIKTLCQAYAVSMSYYDLTLSNCSIVRDRRSSSRTAYAFSLFARKN